MRLNFDINALPSPCYVVDTDLLRKNLLRLRQVMEASGCRILLAQKAFSLFDLYPLLAEFLSGAASSSLFEARLGKEHMGGEAHIFSPAYTEADFEQIASICDHIVFNSFAQLGRFKAGLLSHNRCGLRVNPQISTQDAGQRLYDPCAPGSRLGITKANFKARELAGVSGLHFHTLCEQNSDALSLTWAAVEKNFGVYLRDMEWLNMGGGHHITRDGYDLELLLKCIAEVKAKYRLEVYLEPGEAVVLNSGFLVSTVVDVVENGASIAVLDASAACHMPDVLEAPYLPPLLGSAPAGQEQFTYRLAGPTCLAGDVIGDYSFKAPLRPGARLAFADMAHYSMVKNNTFNGVKLPAIALCQEGQVEVLKTFGYEDFKNRLGSGRNFWRGRLL
jgi:carboxynorspermidine decarboxylase